FHLRLLDQLHVVLVEVLSQPRIEELLLHLGVDGELVADALRDLAPRAFIAVLFLLELVEELLDLAMVRDEKLERERLRARRAAFCPCHDVLLANGDCLRSEAFMLQGFPRRIERRMRNRIVAARAEYSDMTRNAFAIVVVAMVLGACTRAPVNDIVSSRA